MALALAACGGHGAPHDPAVAVGEAWARVTPSGTTVGAAYLTLRSGADDELVGVEIDPDVAASAELHTMVTVGGSDMTSMEHLDGLALPAGEDVAIDGIHDHVMLVDLVRPLTAGGRFDLTLDFAHAPSETVTVEVRSGPP